MYIGMANFLGMGRGLIIFNILNLTILGSFLYVQASSTEFSVKVAVLQLYMAPDKSGELNIIF